MWVVGQPKREALTVQQLNLYLFEKKQFCNLLFRLFTHHMSYLSWSPWPRESVAKNLENFCHVWDSVKYGRFCTIPINFVNLKEKSSNLLFYFNLVLMTNECFGIQFNHLGLLYFSEALKTHSHVWDVFVWNIQWSPKDYIIVDFVFILGT